MPEFEPDVNIAAGPHMMGLSITLRPFGPQKDFDDVLVTESGLVKLPKPSILFQKFPIFLARVY